jgi:hypothetical protein
MPCDGLCYVKFVHKTLCYSSLARLMGKLPLGLYQIFHGGLYA